MNGFDFVAKCLKQEGVEWMACFPANPLIDSVAKIGIRPIVFRQERGGIQAADAYSRQLASRGKIGVFASQGGPGVENAFGGIAQAWGDAVPLVYLPGGHGTFRADVEPGFSAPENYKNITKVALTVNRIERTSQQVRRVFHAAPVFHQVGNPQTQAIDQHDAARPHRRPQRRRQLQRGLHGAPNRAAPLPVPRDARRHLIVAGLGGGDIDALQTVLIGMLPDQPFGVTALARTGAAEYQRDGGKIAHRWRLAHFSLAWKMR